MNRDRRIIGKKNKMNKKSILFSLMTLMILLPIFIISNLNLENNERQNSHANKYIYAQRLVYIEDDIATDLIDLLGLDFTIYAPANNTRIRFTDLNLSDTNAKLTNYKTFIEQEYSPVINMPIELNLSSGIMMNNMNLTISEDYLLIDNITDLNRINIRIKALDATIMNYTDYPGNSGSTSVDIVIEDYWGSEVLDEFVNLDLSLNNDDFEAKYNSSSTNGISAKIGNNQLIISSNITIRVELLELELIDNRSVTFIMGNLKIPEYLGISKEKPLVLARG